jgi:hypothetical protein
LSWFIPLSLSFPHKLFSFHIVSSFSRPSKVHTLSLHLLLSCIQPLWFSPDAQWPPFAISPFVPLSQILHIPLFRVKLSQLLTRHKFRRYCISSKKCAFFPKIHAPRSSLLPNLLAGESFTDTVDS